MKRFFLLSTLLCCVLALSAQEKVEPDSKHKLVSADYLRNSLSVVVVERGDGYDARVSRAIASIDWGDKFDKNIIPTDYIELDSARMVAPNISEMTARIKATRIGQEVVNYWFTQGIGDLMSGSLIEERGRYTATDQDVLGAGSAKIQDSALSDLGYSLLNKSYVLAVDCCRFEHSKSATGDISVSALVTLCVYKVDFDEDGQNEFYENCWIDYSTPEGEIADKKNAFERMNIPVNYICTASSTASASDEDGNGLASAIHSALASAFSQLENRVDDWHVKASVLQLHPVGVKIGTKEGLKNRDRYIAYETVRKDVNGEWKTYSKKRGYLRATQVANNSENATGASQMSEFYQISDMRNVEMGYLVEQSNDLGIGVELSYSTAPLSLFNVTIDYLSNIKSNGASSYVIVDMGYDVLSGSNLNDAGLCGVDYNMGISFLNAGVGLGYGVRATRTLELVPSIIVGCDIMQLNSELVTSEGETGASTSSKCAYYGKAGAKLNVNIAYPLQFVVGASYALVAAEGLIYEYYNDRFAKCGIGRHGGLGLSFGVKYVF